MNTTYKVGQKILVKSPITTSLITKDKIYLAEVISTPEVDGGFQMAFKIKHILSYVTPKRSYHINYNDWIVVESNVTFLTSIKYFLMGIFHGKL